jgi:presequence protease
MNKNYGFIKTREIPIKELDAVLCQYTHEKTGLELIWINRKEENKTFSIAFETLPENDTGVFHILEHSTLCGSDKYPVKEPFVELMKNSMNTFLNAMTFPDKTVYPISSKNNKDFMNLVSVYLDAVFAPSIYHKPEIFRQEGWHYEFDEEGNVCYNGVVFNEMKGVYSDPDELTENAMTEALFPDTPYHYAYGGDPAKIPDLTYEEFLNIHRRFYSPSNAYVVLDGDIDIDAVLKLLDEEYLSKHEKTERLAPPPIQKPVNKGLVESKYEVSCEEEEVGTARLIFGNVIGDYSEREKFVAMEILSEILCGNNQSPLCKAVLEAEIAEDVIMSVQGEVLQPYTKIELRNMNAEDEQKAEEIVYSVLKETAEKGIDRELLNSTIANAEFRMKERDYSEYPQGLMLCFQVLDSILYGGAPEANLEVDKLFENLKVKAEKGYFEELIKEILINNPHKCKILLAPSHTLGEERAEAEINRMGAELDALSEEDVQKLVDEQKSLIEWQTSEDTPETLALMPTLTLSDIDSKPENVPSEISVINDITVIKHPIAHNGLCYCNLYFDVDNFSEEELSALSFLCELFGKLDTDKYSAEKLTNEIREIFGSLEFSIMPFAGENETLTCKTKLCASFSTMSENLNKAILLAIHILQSTKLTDGSQILNIIRQKKIELSQEIMMSGSSAALGRLSAGTTVSGVVSECTSGIAYYQYLKTLDKKENFDYLNALKDYVLCKDKLTVSFTGDIPEIDFEPFKAFPVSETEKEAESLKPWGALCEGVAIPSDVSFAAMGGNIVSHGGKFSSKISLASHIISLDYLWNVVRVQGGAYGTGLSIRESGFCGCYSYRDPSAASSLDAFSHIGEFLEEALEEDEDLTGAIIGTIADASPLLSVRMKGQNADALYFKNVSYDDLCGRRQKLLNCTAKDFMPVAQQLTDTMQKDCGICVIGSKEQIEECGCIDKIISL